MWSPVERQRDPPAVRLRVQPLVGDRAGREPVAQGAAHHRLGEYNGIERHDQSSRGPAALN